LGCFTISLKTFGNKIPCFSSKSFNSWSVHPTLLRLLFYYTLSFFLSLSLSSSSPLLLSLFNFLFSNPYLIALTWAIVFIIFLLSSFSFSLSISLSPPPPPPLFSLPRSSSLLLIYLLPITWAIVFIIFFFRIGINLTRIQCVPQRTYSLNSYN
jgi:hypothetical protein